MADRALLAKLHARGLDIADAGAKAGYKHRQNAWRALKSKETKKIYERELKKVEKQIDVDFNYKINKLREIVELCSTDKSSAKTSVTAISELNKMQGHHAAQKHILSTDDDYRDKLEQSIKDAAEYKK